MKYGIDILAPTTIKGDDGWRPVMENELARKTFGSIEDLFAFLDQMQATNRTLQTRVVEVYDMDPTYSV